MRTKQLIIKDFLDDDYSSFQNRERAVDLHGPGAMERNLLDQELDQYQADRDIGAEWSVVEKRLRNRAGGSGRSGPADGQFNGRLR